MEAKEAGGAAEWPARLPGEEAERYVLRLYVTGTTANSIRAISNLQKICEEHFPGGCDLEVIDLYQQPHLAAQAGIIAAPTLVKHRPEPLRRIIGDLSDRERVLRGLDLHKKI